MRDRQSRTDTDHVSPVAGLATTRRRSPARASVRSTEFPAKATQLRSCLLIDQSRSTIIRLLTRRRRTAVVSSIPEAQQSLTEFAERAYGATVTVVQPLYQQRRRPTCSDNAMLAGNRTCMCTCISSTRWSKKIRPL